MSRIIPLLVFILLVSNAMYAQNLNNIQRGQRGYVPEPKNFISKTPVSIKNPVKETNKIVAISKEKFQLDDFETEILKSMTLTKIEQENTILLNDKFDATLRHKSLLALEKQYYVDLKNTGVFSEDEIEAMKLMDFDDEVKSEKDSKKKKRKKNKRKNKKTS